MTDRGHTSHGSSITNSGATVERFRVMLQRGYRNVFFKVGMRKILSLSGFLSLVFAFTAHAEPDLSAQLWSGEFPHPQKRISVHEDDHLYVLSFNSDYSASSPEEFNGHVVEFAVEEQIGIDHKVGPSPFPMGDIIISFRGPPGPKAAQGYSLGTFTSVYRGGWLDWERENEIKQGIAIYTETQCDESETSVDTVTVKRFALGRFYDAAHDPHHRVVTELDIEYDKTCTTQHELIRRTIAHGTVKLTPSAAELSAANELLRGQLKDSTTKFQRYVIGTEQMVSASLSAMNNSLRICSSGNLPLCLTEIKRSITVLRSRVPNAGPAK